MISEKMQGYVNNSSAIRAMFEEGKKLASVYGAENVYDFSLGNPNVPAPAAVKEAALQVLNEEDPLMVHGYMSNSGYEDVREAIAASLNRRFGTGYDAGNLVILKWLKTFYRRFFSQQFKRSCLPDGPKVGTVAVSPRGDLRMPSDASAAIWLAELEELG